VTARTAGDRRPDRVAIVKIRVHRARSRLRATLADACDFDAAGSLATARHPRSACDFDAGDRGELICEQR